MSEELAILLPIALLALVVGGYLLTVFEPYYALRTSEGAELLEYHRQDPKLRAIAAWWAQRLVDPGSRWLDESNASVVRVRNSVLEALVRHRFLTGDDPSKLRYGAKVSPVLQRAFAECGLVPPASAVTPRVEMQISAREVRVMNGELVWRGRPAEYKSRFCDFYPEP
jgi:hypothetical protein